MNTLALLTLTLAWRPFVEPLDLHQQWLWLLPPIVVAVAVVYKSLKMPRFTFALLLSESARLSAYILLLMALAGAALYLVVEGVERIS